MAEELIQATRYLEPLDPWCICLVLPTQNMSGVYPLVRARSRFFGWPQVLVVDQCCVCNLLYACLIYQCHGMSLIKLQEDPSLPFPGLVTVVHSEEARFVGSLKSNMFWNAYSCSQWNDFFPCLFFIWGCPCFVCIQRCSVAKFDYLLDEVFQKKATCCTMYRNLITSWRAWAVGERFMCCWIGSTDWRFRFEKSQVGCFRTMDSLVCSLRSNSKRFRGDFNCSHEPWCWQ